MVSRMPRILVWNVVSSGEAPGGGGEYAYLHPHTPFARAHRHKDPQMGWRAPHHLLTYCIKYMNWSPRLLQPPVLCVCVCVSVAWSCKGQWLSDGGRLPKPAP